MASTPENPLKAALAAGRSLQGVWSMSGSPVVVEALAWCRADYLVLDLEHSATSVHGVLPLLQAAEAGGTPVLARMPDHDRTAIKQALDLGAESLMFPFVQTAEEARAIVEACLYPPKGQRGFARMTRASRYVAWADYPERARERTLIVLQLETPEALERIEEIAAVDGVDAVFVGPGDLAASLGHLGQPAHDEVKAMMAACAARAGSIGKPIGTVVGDPSSPPGPSTRAIRSCRSPTTSPRWSARPARCRRACGSSEEFSRPPPGRSLQARGPARSEAQTIVRRTWAFSPRG